MPSIFNTKFMSWVWGRRASVLSLGYMESRGFVLEEFKGQYLCTCVQGSHGRLVVGDYCRRLND